MLWFLLLMVTAACSGGDSTGGPGGSGAVATVEASQPELTIGLGSTAALQVVVRDGAGRTLTGRTVTWTSSDPSVASVSALGVVSALRTGTVQIAATVEGRSAVTNLTVAPKTVASVQVLPSELRLLVGASFQLSARTLDDNGAPLEGRSVVWASSDSRVAVVDTTGHVTAMGPGVATLTATSESRSVSVGVSVTLVPVSRVDVTPVADTIVVGQSTQLSVVLRDSVGGELVDRAVSWGTSNVDVATVSSAGLVIGVTPGVATITAASAGRTADVTIVVRPRPVGSVIVSPGHAALVVGGSVRLTVQVTDDNGVLLPDRAVSFRSDNTAIATVAADGTVTGVGVGATEIVVTSEGRVGRVNVQVSPVPVASVRVEPASVDLTVGESARVAATPLDAGGAALAGRTVVWTSGAPGVATVSSDGTVQAVGPGTAVLLASVEGRTATVTVTVRAVPVGTVTVTPASAMVIIGDALDLTAAVRRADGTVLTDRVVLWTSSDERVAVVSSTGRVRALATGTTQIRASADGVFGASAITVIVEPVLTVTVDPPSLTLTLPSRTGQLVATARGRNGVALPGRAIVFTSSDPTIATVSATGRVTPVRAGSTTIIATSDGRQAIVPVTVLRAPVSTVTATLAATSIAALSTTTATAVLRDEEGNTLADRVVSWSSSNTAVATVSSTGVVTALSVGTTTITATSEDKTGSVSLAVTPAPVATIAVSLGDATLTEGATTQATAVLRDANGGILTGRSVVWSSTNSTVATVSAAGVVTALRAGSTTIIATSENRSSGASLTVTVPPPAAVATVSLSFPVSTLQEGATTTGVAVVRDANGTVLTGRTLTWSSSNTQIATVSSAGVVTALRAGGVTITVAAGSVSGSAPLTITAPPPAPVATVTATVADASLLEGQTTQALAVTRDAAGNTLTGRTVTWASSNTTVATVSSAGLVTALKAGTANITATSETRSGSVTVTVTAAPPIPVATVSVTLASSTVQAGGNTTATAVTRSASGAVLTGRTVTWTTSNAGVATVSSAGVVSALAAGSATITATSEGKTGTATLTVTAPPPAPVATVTVQPTSVSIMEGTTSQVSATLRAADGTVLTGRIITWASSDAQVATVSGTGVVTAVRPGTATITATSEGKSGSGALTVGAAPVGSVSVALGDASIDEGTTTTATATVRSDNGLLLTGRTVTWSSSDTQVATVSSSGVVTAVRAGTASITGTSGGKSGSATLTVAPPPVGQVTVSLDNTAVDEFTGATASAVVRSTTGDVLTGRTVTWTSSDNSIATVSSSGVITTLRAGTVTITGSSGGRSGAATLTVRPLPVARVEVTPSSATIARAGPMTGRSVQLTAKAFAENSRELLGRTFTWTSSRPQDATVDSSGLVRAVSTGSTVITASTGGRSDTAVITVENN